MLAKLEGYHKVEYTRNGENKSFVTVSVSTDKRINYGTEYLHIVVGSKYWEEKILPAFESRVPVHVGFDKMHGNKPFLYLKG